MTNSEISDGFDYPVGKPDGNGYYNAQGFLAKGFKSTPHLGDDWNGVHGGNSDLGDPVYSVSNGKVVYNSSAKGWGNVLIIRHQLPDGKKVESMYGHLQFVYVSNGAVVSRGQKVGTIGTGGGLYVAHLHFEIRDSSCRNFGTPGPGYSSNSQGWLDPTIFIDSHRKLSQFSAAYHSQAQYPTLVAGGRAEQWWIKFSNTGNETWENHNANNKITKLALGTYSRPDMLQGREFGFGWESSTRLAVVEENRVAPNETGTFRFNLIAASGQKPGIYRLYVTPKTPAGWVRKADGGELNCFVDITVTSEATGDYFATQPYNNSHAFAQSRASGDWFSNQSHANITPMSFANAAVGETVVKCSPVSASLDDKNILVYCEHLQDGKKRYYKTNHPKLEVVQTGPEDKITIWTDEPSAPGALTVERDGVQIESIPANGRAGGKEYLLDARYYPKSDPYESFLNSAMSFLRAIGTKSLQPTVYTVKGLSKILTIEAYNPDQWKFSISLPPFDKMSMGRVLDNSDVSHFSIHGSIALSQQIIRGKRWDEYSHDTWKTSETINIEESYEAYCKTLVSPYLYSYAEEGSYAFKRERKNKSASFKKEILKSIKLTRNSQSAMPDRLDFILAVVSLGINLVKMVKTFRHYVPKIGWYLDFSLSILEGTFEIAWGWREYEDHRVYYYIGAGIKLKLIELQFEAGFGVDVKAFKAQVCGQYKGLIEMNIGQFETTSPTFKDSQITLGDVTGTIQGGFYARVVVGFFLNCETGVESGIQTEMKAVYSFSEGFKFEGRNKWTGITVIFQVSTGMFGLGPKKNEKKTIVDEVTMDKFEIPSSKKPPVDDLSKYEISNHLVRKLEEGWNIRVKKIRTRTVQKEKLFSDETYEVQETTKEKMATKDIADIIADKIYSKKDEIFLDQKTVEGICHSVRKKMDILGDRFGRDWVDYDTMVAYLNGADFAGVLRNARDPVKMFTKR